LGWLHGIKPLMQQIEIPWHGAATLAWDGDEVVDVTSGQRGNFTGSLTPRLLNMTFRFDRAIGLRSHEVLWTAAYANRGTKAVLMKNGSVHRELNRSFYCAEAYDYPIALGLDGADRAVVVHCPSRFDLLEIEDAETGAALDSLRSKDMEFHSRLSLSPDGRLLMDAGWFWHPWCGATVFQITQTGDGSLQFKRDMAFSAVFSTRNEIDSVAFLGNTRLVVSSVSDYLGEEPESGSLCPKQLGVWSLSEHRWESKVDVCEPIGMMMPWREWIVGFYDHPKLIELATGKVVYRWDKIYSGKQLGPIELGDPPPPPMAVDRDKGRFAVASSKTVTLVSL
jgi:hypothetical protein